jgi:CRISPR-associated protein Cmr1
MTLSKGERTYQCKALTDLWTGSVTLEEKDGRIKEKTGPDRLITTGLLGSIRWWFEVLVRGLGGGACDPSDTKCEDRNHCVVCELFGCTGWARKFRFEVLDEKGKIKTDQIKQDKPFFSLRFTPLRPIRLEEWALLDVTLRLIAEYGSIGGKTVFKPTDESSRAGKLHHKDYGLVQMATSHQLDGTGRGDLETYLSKWLKLNHGEFVWTSLQHFWCVNGKYLARQNSNASSFNRVIGRPEPKGDAKNNDYDSWLAGSQRKSKKVFSFKNPARTFGFVKQGLIDFTAIQQKLTNAWGTNGWKFFTGNEIINHLLADKEDRP